MDVDFDFVLGDFIESVEVDSIGVVDGHVGLYVFILLDSDFGFDEFCLVELSPCFLDLLSEG